LSFLQKISVGLGASLILLVIALVLVGKLEGKAEAVDSTGILHLIWLFRDRPDLTERITRVEKPTVAHLRTAGMFQVRLAGEGVPVTDTSYLRLRLNSVEPRD
jgi:hypothetical protein